MPVKEGPTPTSPVEAARVAIWRLFQEGYVDEDMATASLLAVDIGARRGPKDARARQAVVRAHASFAAAKRPRSTR